MLKKIFHKLKAGLLRDILQETLWIYRRTRAYKKAIVSYTLLGLLTTVISLVSSLLSKELINAIIAKEGWFVLRNGIFVVVFSAISILVGAFVNRYSTKINLRVSNSLRAEVYEVFMNTDWESLQQFHSGDLLTRINNDVSTISSSVLGWVPTLIIKSAQFVLSLGVILIYDPTMALLALLTAPVTLFVAKPFVRKMRKLNQDMRTVNSEMISFHEETLQNVQPIKAFNLVDTFCARLGLVQQKYYDTAMSFNKFSVFNSSLLSLVSMLVGNLCLGWGAYRLWLEKIDFGTMVLFIQLAGYLATALSALISLMPSVIECTTAAQRVMLIFDLPRETKTDLDKVQALRGKEVSLQLRGLRFSYQSQTLILDDLELNIHAGETVAVVGPSGSGKTTLFRILLGLLNPTAGAAELVCGEERIPLSPSTRCMFAYVPQDNVIFSGTIADTLRLVKPDATDEEIHRALRLACAEDFVSALPNGIHTALKERGSTLSIGQNQRLAIARAILADAPILLLDEVTSALDLETEEKVLQNIASLRDKTCIISTHRPSVLSLCDRIYRIRKRKLEILPDADLSGLIRK